MLWSWVCLIVLLHATKDTTSAVTQWGWLVDAASLSATSLVVIHFEDIALWYELLT